MNKERKIKDYKKREIKIPQKSFIESESEFIPLCLTCKKSRMTCENVYIREIEIPVMRENDPKEIAGEVRQIDGSYQVQKLGFKLVDGVKEGLIKSEDEIPMPFICNWFEPKDLNKDKKK